MQMHMGLSSLAQLLSYQVTAAVHSFTRVHLIAHLHGYLEIVEQAATTSIAAQLYFHLSDTPCTIRCPSVDLLAGVMQLFKAWNTRYGIAGPAK